MTQTLALLLDAYRELNHRKLFWISLVISLVVVVAVASFGINERGLTFLHWTMETPRFTTSLFSQATFYKLAFVTLGVDIWLTWIATILALISTAGMIPDLVSSGSIDLMVSKPIGRGRLFLTKFVGGLIFAGMQVTVFSTASFIVIGVRGGEWVPGIFLAIPLVLLFYSYLFSFCALVGLLTRSTVASLLLTLIFWGFCSGAWGAAVLVNGGRISSELEIKAIERLIAERVAERGEGTDLSKLEEDLANQKDSLWWWSRFNKGTEWVATVVPKTSATIDLLQRQLISRKDMPNPPENRNEPMFGTRRVRQRDLVVAVENDMQRFSTTWVIGTSLAFEALILGVCVLIFSRRDY